MIVAIVAFSFASRDLTNRLDGVRGAEVGDNQRLEHVTKRITLVQQSWNTASRHRITRGRTGEFKRKGGFLQCTGVSIIKRHVSTHVIGPAVYNGASVCTYYQYTLVV